MLKRFANEALETTKEVSCHWTKKCGRLSSSTWGIMGSRILRVQALSLVGRHDCIMMLMREATCMTRFPQMRHEWVNTDHWLDLSRLHTQEVDYVLSNWITFLPSRHRLTGVGGSWEEWLHYIDTVTQAHCLKIVFSRIKQDFLGLHRARDGRLNTMNTWLICSCCHSRITLEHLFGAFCIIGDWSHHHLCNGPLWWTIFPGWKTTYTEPLSLPCSIWQKVKVSCRLDTFSEQLGTLFPRILDKFVHLFHAIWCK